MSNPFASRKNHIKPSKYIRDIFKDKKINDTFEIIIPPGFTIPQIRANMHDTLKKTNFKYTTKTNDNKLYVLILEA